jgi:hypothetical protein
VSDVVGSRARPPTRGIGSTSTNPVVSGVTIRNTALRDLAVGIDAHANCANPASRFSNVVIEQNQIDGIHGTYGGSGYGIWLSCADSVVVRDNVIRRSTRHAIYAGDTRIPNAGPIVILRNAIIDHGHAELIHPDPQKSLALSVARSDNVTVIDNVFVRSHTFALSTEWEPYTNKSCTRCLLVGNKFINVDGAPSDLWVRVLPTDTAWLWLNTRFDGKPASLTVERGNYEEVGGPGDFWAGSEAVSAVRDTGGVELLRVFRNGEWFNVAMSYGVKPDSAGRTRGWTAFARVPSRVAGARSPANADGDLMVVVGDSVYYRASSTMVCAAKRGASADSRACSSID